VTEAVTARAILDGLKIRQGQNTDIGNYSVVLLAERDPILGRLLAAWPNVPRATDPNPEEVCPEGTPKENRLRWLWSRVPEDVFLSWARLAGLPEAAHIRRAQWVAIENRMVLPDGTLAPALQGLIQGLVVQATKRLTGAGPKPAKVEDKRAGQDRK
jgi:hypothetical protein